MADVEVGAHVAVTKCCPNGECGSCSEVVGRTGVVTVTDDSTYSYTIRFHETWSTHNRFTMAEYEVCDVALLEPVPTFITREEADQWLRAENSR